MDACTISVDEIENNQVISRSQEPEYTLKFWKVENLNVKDENGTEFRFGDLYKDTKSIIIFLRHFLCHMSKEYVDDAALIPEKYLKAANVNLILIGCGRAKFIKPFREVTGYRGPIYVDETRELYKAIELREKSNAKLANVTKVSPHIKSNIISGVAKSTWRGMQFKESQGDMAQQGGALIIGPGDVLHHQHFDYTAADHAHLNDLLIMAGVEPVNFPNDKRVFIV